MGKSLESELSALRRLMRQANKQALATTSKVNRKYKPSVAKDCSPVPTKRQRRTCPLELEFEVIRGSNSSGKSTSFKCKHCSVVLILDSTDIGLELKCHLDVCAQFASQTKLKLYEKLLNLAVVRHGISLTYPANIQPTCTMTSKQLCLELYEKEKAKLKQGFESIPSRVSLTCDIFTDAANMEYLCLSAHYVDDNWKLNSKLLNLVRFPPTYRAPIVAVRVDDLLEDWGIANKILTITLDNRTCCDTMQQTLLGKLSVYNKEREGALSCEDEFLYVCSCATALDDIAQEAFQMIEDLIHKIREGLKLVLTCKYKLEEFIRVAKSPHSKCGCSEGLWLDCPGRWVSTYRMLEKILRCQDPFSCAVLKGMSKEEELANGCGFMKPVDWSRVKNICKLLKPLYHMTNLFMGNKYPTANLFFIYVWETGMRLLEAMEDEDLEFQDLIQRLKGKFDEYWESYNVKLASAIILDPRYKLRFVESCYEELDEATAEERCASIQKRLQKIFLAYASKRFSSGDSEQISPVCYSRFEEWRKAEQLHSVYSQLDIYLVEPTVVLGDQLDVLSWWKQNQTHFPELSLMAIDMLSTPITTFCADSAFNTGNRISHKWRSTVLSEDAEVQIVTRNWLYGFDIDANELRELVGVQVPILKPKEVVKISNTKKGGK